MIEHIQNDFADVFHDFIGRQINNLLTGKKLDISGFAIFGLMAWWLVGDDRIGNVGMEMIKLPDFVRAIKRGLRVKDRIAETGRVAGWLQNIDLFCYVA